MSFKTLNLKAWLLTVAAIVSIAVTARLGYWQLSRANEKIELQANMQLQTALPTLAGQTLFTVKDITTYSHRKVKLTGHWLEQYTLFLDNRQMDGKPGFFVLTPFEFQDKTLGLKKTILVQRGWIARNFLDRQQLPQIKQTQGEVTILGRIAPSPSKLYEFKGTESGAIRQNTSIDELSQEFKIELLNMTIQQIEEPNVLEVDDGLLRHWLQPNVGIEKHYGYMFQWWALSALIALLFVWFQIIRPRMPSRIKVRND